MIAGIPARHVLCFLLFLGYFMAFMLRVNLSVAIVIMVRHNASSPSHRPAEVNECNPQQQTPALNVTNIDNNTLQVELAEENSGGEFEWDEVTQSFILGAFFWGYLFSQAPGGRIAEVYGPRKVFGFALLANAILCGIMPLATRLHWSLLLAVRALQGLAQGPLFPCINAVVARWCPPDERDRFISFSVQGATIGAVVSLPLCGLVGSSLGWDAIFYVTSGITILWSVAWFTMVADSPQIHPRISEKERAYLAKTVPPNSNKARPVPWLKAITSVQFLLGCIAAIGNDYGFHTLLTFAPKFMRSALGFDLQQNTLMSSLPFLCQYFFAIAYGILMGKLLQRGWPVIRIRKISICCSHLVPALGLVVLSLAGCDVMLSVGALIVSVGFMGAFTCGYFQNPLDVAPNFAGSLTGVMNMLGSLTGIVASPVAGLILHHQGISGWRTIFLISSATYTACALPYLLFATAKIQPWNDENKTEEEAAVPMRQVTEKD